MINGEPGAMIVTVGERDGTERDLGMIQFPKRPQNAL